MKSAQFIDVSMLAAVPASHDIARTALHPVSMWAAHDGPEGDEDDGRLAMQKIFVDGRLISPGDFNALWHTPDLHEPPRTVIEPFIQLLAEKGLVPLDKSLKVLCERSRLGFLPLEKYDIDIELARNFPREVCHRWCLLPFDRMSKSVLVATANPFNKQAVWELENATKNRLLWYVSPPAELVKALRRTFR